MADDAKKELIPIPSIGTGVEDVNAPKGVLKAEPRDTGTDKTGEKQPEKPKEDNVPFHEHPRFKQVISEKNTLKTKVEELEAKLSQVLSKPVQTSADVSRVNNIVKRFVETSTMDEANAKALVDDLKAEIMASLEPDIKPLKEDYNSRKEREKLDRIVEDNWSRFKEERGVDKETETKMQNLFMKLSREERAQVSLDQSHFGLNMLYRMAKDGKESVETEKPAATSTAPKTGSVAGKTTGTATTGYKFKMSEINAMSKAEFAKRYDEIQTAKNLGQIDVNS